MSVIKLEANGLEGLLEEVLKIAKNLPHDRALWYRGIPCHTFELTPKIMRDGKSAEQVFERERRLLTRFRQRSVAYWPAGYPQNDWEHLFAMQHFGVPTRLLDWSENLFVAAHFAITPPPQHSHDPCDVIVWCLDPIEWNRATPVLSEYGELIQVLTTADDEMEAYSPLSQRKRMKSPIAMFGAHNSDRIVAQRGTFMVWGNQVQPLETIASELAARVWRIAVTGNRADLAHSLRALGFGETMIFPELPSLGAEISRTEGWRS